MTARTEITDPANLIVRSVVTTRTPDRAGDIVLPQGLRNRDEFLANPVVLWAHQRNTPPIGRCLSLEVQPDRVIAETQFAAASPFAVELFGLYAAGVLSGWSIGFLPIRTSPRRGGGTQVDSWDLLEYSAVPVPENPQALTMAVRKGLTVSPMLQQWLRQDVLAALCRVGEGFAQPTISR